MSTMVEIYCLSAPSLTVISSLYYDSTNLLNPATHLTHILPAVHLLLHGSPHHFSEPYLTTLESPLGSCELGMSAPNRSVMKRHTGKTVVLHKLSQKATMSGLPDITSQHYISSSIVSVPFPNTTPSFRHRTLEMHMRYIGPVLLCGPGTSSPAHVTTCVTLAPCYPQSPGYFKSSPCVSHVPLWYMAPGL